MAYFYSIFYGIRFDARSFHLFVFTVWHCLTAFIVYFCFVFSGAAIIPFDILCGFLFIIKIGMRIEAKKKKKKPHCYQSIRKTAQSLPQWNNKHVKRNRYSVLCSQCRCINISCVLDSLLQFYEINILFYIINVRRQHSSLEWIEIFLRIIYVFCAEKKYLYHFVVLPIRSRKKNKTKSQNFSCNYHFSCVLCGCAMRESCTPSNAFAASLCTTKKK